MAIESAIVWYLPIWLMQMWAVLFQFVFNVEFDYISIFWTNEITIKLNSRIALQRKIKPNKQTNEGSTCKMQVQAKWSEVE